jgi:uncharacterized membrane protein YphA (DoxX/SURF4 family)
MRESITPPQVRSNNSHGAVVDRATLVRRLKLAGMWIPVLLLAFIFIPQGWSKFSDASGWARAFRGWGYPDWFRVTIGVLELAAVALMFSWRWAAWGALIVIVVMLGGMGTHIVYDQGRHLTSEVVPLTLGAIVLVIHRRRIRG